MPEAIQRGPRPDRGTAHEIAAIERDLRASTTEGVEVIVGQTGARLYVDTWEPNEADRGTLLAGLCRAVADTDYWELARIHDPLPRDDSQLVSSAVTVRRVEGEDD